MQFIVMVLKWVARLGQRAEAELVEEILLHHDLEYRGGSSPAYCDSRDFREGLAFSMNLWRKPSREGDLYVHLGIPGVDESVLVWECLNLPESAGWEDNRNLVKISVSELDAVLSRRLGTPRFF